MDKNISQVGFEPWTIAWKASTLNNTIPEFTTSPYAYSFVMWAFTLRAKLSVIVQHCSASQLC
jgi:hypothetical protein